MDSFSFSFWGYRSENWAKKICCHLQNLNSKATVLQRHSSAEAKSSGNSNIATPYRCMFVVAQWVALLSKRTYQQKRLVYFNHEKAPVIHAALEGDVAHFQY